MGSSKKSSKKAGKAKKASEASEVSASASASASGPVIDTALASLLGSSGQILPKKQKTPTIISKPEPAAQTEEPEAMEVDEDKDEGEDEESKPEPEVESEEPVKRKEKRHKKKKDENEDLENNYIRKLIQSEAPKDTPEAEEKEKSEADNEKPQQDGFQQFQHESLTKADDELEKADRTLFVGNVPASIIKDKKLDKKFVSLFAKYGKVESHRYRSVAFATLKPRKASFVTKDLHPERHSMNAYVVMETKEGMRKCLELNGTVFENFHLRIDSVTHPAKHDTKRSVFVGNLDFEAEDEELWNFFSSCGEIEYVRIIRDTTTNVGKGFAYVQFKDINGVAKALLLDGKKSEEKGRALRVSRCKNMSKGVQKKRVNGASVMDRLSQEERTKIGKSQRVLSKSDRGALKQMLTIEGQRAKVGARIEGVKVGKKKQKGGKVKKPRIRERSTNFKKQQLSHSNEKGSK